MKTVISIYLLVLPTLVQAQKVGLDEIKSSNLKATIEFLASDVFKGRKTGENENNIAARYLASEAAKLELKPIGDEGTFLQRYQLTKNSLIKDSSWIDIQQAGRKMRLAIPSLVVNPLPNEDILLEGTVVFAGYGINSAEDNYNDLNRIDAKDKIIMVLDRAPTLPDGKTGLLKDKRWLVSAKMDAKYYSLIELRPKAILLVLDPKSNHNSIDEVIPDAIRDMSEQYSLTGIRLLSDFFANSLPRVVVITEAIADSILLPANIKLKALQEKIDSECKPSSMEIPLTHLGINIHIQKEQVNAFNVAGMIEGSDPVEKKDAIIYTAHFDHIGVDADGKINYGADDNASGTAALIELAKAFKRENTKIKRSVIILWVSGEELGLMGSKFYTEKPLYPLANTIADINLDMIGRSWTGEDTGMVRGEIMDVKKNDSVFAAGGKTCAELIRLNDKVAKQMNMQIDYAYNSPKDISGMYYRSDHYNFAQKKIPVIFYTTGLHKDYHSPGDIPSKLDYVKMVKVSKLAFMLGYELATQKHRLANDSY